MQPFGVLDRYIGKTIFTTIMMTLFMLVSALAGLDVMRGIDKPIGVSSYELTRALPKALRSSLPSVEQLESELGALDSGTKEPDE